MIQRHPHDDLLLSYAAGSLDEGSSLIVATHLTFCAKCRMDVLVAETVGGALLDAIAPVEMGDAADVMDRLDEPAAVPSRATKETGFPRTLDPYLPDTTVAWRWFGPGLHYAELLKKGGTKVGLLRCAPGAEVPLHSHRGEELTLVLAGNYHDGESNFSYGDVQCADDTLQHRPVAHADIGCTVLIMNKGNLRPKSVVARLFVRILGM